MHKQIMRPSKPITEDDFFSVGPTYFCNRWDGGGREEWEFAGKMTCSIGDRDVSEGERRKIIIQPTVELRSKGPGRKGNSPKRENISSPT